MSKVLHLNTPVSSESTVLSTWSSTSSISTLSSVSASSTVVLPQKPSLETGPIMLRTGSSNDVLGNSHFEREQRIAELVLNNPDIASTASGKPQIVFIHKLYDMLSNDSISNLIRWAPDLTSFYVFPGEKFCKVLAQYFKHTNVSSFIRQLNMYGFHKVSDNNSSAPSSESKNNSRWEFRHSQNQFKKGDIESLKYIKRRSSKTVNVQKEVVDLKSIPHPGEFSSRHPEHEHSPFNTHYSTPSPSQAPRNGYSMFPYQMPQTPQFSLDVPVLQPSLQIQTQQIDRLVPKLKSPLTPIQPTTSLQNLNQRGPDSTLPLPQALQGRPQDYVHQRPPISTQYSFEGKAAAEATNSMSTEMEYWKRKHCEISADFDTLVGIVERGTNINVEYQKFKESMLTRRLLHHQSTSSIAAPQADKASSLSTYYPQYKPKFNPPTTKQRAESKSYSPLSTTTAQREQYLHKHQQVSVDMRIPPLMVPQTQRTNSLPGELREETGKLSPAITRTLVGKRNSDSLISAPKLPSVNELTMNLPVFNPNMNFKRKRSQ